jgi:hypothetical protein
MSFLLDIKLHALDFMVTPPTIVAVHKQYFGGLIVVSYVIFVLCYPR